MCILAVNDASFISLSTLNIHNEVNHFNSMKYVNIYFSNIFISAICEFTNSNYSEFTNAGSSLQNRNCKTLYIHVHATYSLHFN